MMKKYILPIIVSLSLLFLCFCGEHTGSPDTRGDHIQQAQKNIPGGHVNSRQEGERVVTLSEEELSQIEIKTVTVKENPIREILKAMGKVQAPPEAKAIVGYAFPGRIVKIHVSIGQWVKKDQPLVTLECEEVGNAKSGYFKNLTEYRLTKENFAREDRLFKKDIGAKKDYLESKAQLSIARSSLEAARKKLQVMGFTVREIEELSSGEKITPFVTVHAPIAGRVAINNVVLGAMIEPTTEIMIILDPTTLCIDADLYEKDLAKIKTRQEVRVEVPAYPGEAFVGRVSYISDIVHPETRTITVRTRIANQDFRLKPGMFADIGILVDQRKQALTLPLEAVLDELDRKIVFVREGGRYVCRVVEVGPKFNGYIEIVKGLKKGEIVVVEGNYQLKSRLYQETLTHAH